MSHLIDLKTLYEKYGFIIYRRCLHILRSEDDAQDAMHSVFVKFADEYHKIKEKGAAIAWIYKAATNHCFNILRYNKKFHIGIEPDLLAGEQTDIESQLNARTVIALLMRGVDKNIRDAVYFTYVEELSQEEIRTITGQSPATIRRNLAKFKIRVEQYRTKDVA